MMVSAPGTARQVSDKPQGRKPRVVYAGRCSKDGLWGFGNFLRSIGVVSLRLVKRTGSAMERCSGKLADLVVNVPGSFEGLFDFQRQSANRQPGRRERPAIVECFAVMMIMDRRPVVVELVAGHHARRSR